MKFDAFQYVTFDCYGTLIDWESGILGALGPLLSAHGREVDDAAILGMFGELESSAEAVPYRTYREVLAEVVDGFGRAFGFTPSGEERDLLSESIGDWPPFPDAASSLRALATRYRLGVISNVDDDLFSRSLPKLEVDFDEVVTAQQVRSYKPSLQNFLAAFERLGQGPEGVLHVAQSLFHDIAPARELGLACVWVNRRAGKNGPGATPPAEAEPDLAVSDLETLTLIMGLD